MWLIIINLNSKKVNTLKVGHNVLPQSWPIHLILIRLHPVIDKVSDFRAIH